MGSTKHTTESDVRIRANPDLGDSLRRDNWNQRRQNARDEATPQFPSESSEYSAGMTAVLVDEVGVKSCFQRKSQRKYLTMKNLVLAAALLSFLSLPTVSAAPAPTVYRYRQYYSGWRYQPSRRYYVRRYYYKPVSTNTSYSYHYCVYYPSSYSTRRRYSRYVYFYNPQRRVYWGRFDLEGEPGKQYSLLKKEDQKADLEKIPESAFPSPGQMPFIPESEDQVRMDPLKKTDLPEEDNADDLPKAPKDEGEREN